MKSRKHGCKKILILVFDAHKQQHILAVYTIKIEGQRNKVSAIHNKTQEQKPFKVKQGIITDRQKIINLTQYIYFNLCTAPSSS